MNAVIKFIDENFKIIFKILIILVIGLFCLNLALSRYSSSFSKVGAVSVAKYTLNQSGTIDLRMIAPGETVTYNFEVSNQKDGMIAEVAQDYNIKIVTTNNLPLKFSLTGAEPSQGTLASDIDVRTLTTLISGSFPHTEEAVHFYTLNITWPAGKVDSEYLNEVDQVSLNIEAIQRK